MNYKDEQMTWAEYLEIKKKALKCKVCGKTGGNSYFCKDCYAQQVKARKQRLGQPIEDEVKVIELLPSQRRYRSYKGEYTRLDLLKLKIDLKHANRCIKRLNWLLRSLQRNVKQSSKQMERKYYLELKLGAVSKRRDNIRASIKDAYRYFRTNKVV